MCEVNHDVLDNMKDAQADEIIRNCLSLNESFILLAGAGSGKTRSLVDALEYIKKAFGTRLMRNNQYVAVITYTKAARDEILRRINHSTLFSVSTIHSFAWELIKPHTRDIRLWLQNRLQEKIREIEAEQNKPRVNTASKAYNQRAKKIESYRQRLKILPTVSKFIYNPDGNNTEKNSLDHSEVIQITAELLKSKPTLEKILVDKFPILLIDESQDTKAELLKAILTIQRENSKYFIVGLFGDTMQRIYLDGIPNLLKEIPLDWKCPSKKMNHRSQKRIVELCNQIRNGIDDFIQESRYKKDSGVVRIFISDRKKNSDITEKLILSQMVKITGDKDWAILNKVKFLTIEHDMAAKRLGFFEFFSPLYRISSFKTSLLDGTLPAIRPFISVALPIFNARKTGDPSEITRIVRERSTVYQEAVKDKNLDKNKLSEISNYVKKLVALWDDDKDPTCIEVLRCMVDGGIFEATDDLKILATTKGEDNNNDDEISANDKFLALEQAFKSPFSQVASYFAYISGKASFSTHQGVKGLEFPRVAVVIDDEEAITFRTFSYDKLFGIKEKSDNDIRNEKDGRETTLDRTRRLLYVTCSRAEESLAIVYYSDNVERAIQQIKNIGWFLEHEIVTDIM